MTTKLRRATVDDIPHLARFAIEAYGGYFEVLYDGLAPGRSTESLIQSSFSQLNTTPFYENHFVAMHNGEVAGGMHAFPFEDIEGFPRDSLVPEERHVVAEEAFNDIPAPGTFYIHVLTIYPEFHRKGIASTLLSLALKQTAETGLWNAASMFPQRTSEPSHCTRSTVSRKRLAPASLNIRFYTIRAICFL